MTDPLEQVYPSAYTRPHQVVKQAQAELFDRLGKLSEMVVPLSQEVGEQCEDGEPALVDASGVLILLGISFPYRLNDAVRRTHNDRQRVRAKASRRPITGEELSDKQIWAAKEIGHELNTKRRDLAAVGQAILAQQLVEGTVQHLVDEAQSTSV